MLSDFFRDHLFLAPEGGSGTAASVQRDIVLIFRPIGKGADVAYRMVVNYSAEGRYTFSTGGDIARRLGIAIDGSGKLDFTQFITSAPVLPLEDSPDASLQFKPRNLRAEGAESIIIGEFKIEAGFQREDFTTIADIIALQSGLNTYSGEAEIIIPVPPTSIPESLLSQVSDIASGSEGSSPQVIHRRTKPRDLPHEMSMKERITQSSHLAGSVFTDSTLLETARKQRKRSLEIRSISKVQDIHDKFDSDSLLVRAGKLARECYYMSTLRYVGMHGDVESFGMRAASSTLLAAERKNAIYRDEIGFLCS